MSINLDVGQFLRAGGRIDYALWLMLDEEQRSLAAEAGDALREQQAADTADAIVARFLDAMQDIETEGANAACSALAEHFAAKGAAS